LIFKKSAISVRQYAPILQWRTADICSDFKLSVIQNRICIVTPMMWPRVQRAGGVVAVSNVHRCPCCSYRTFDKPYAQLSVLIAIIRLSDGMT
jgi:hypothetical protein